MPAIAFLVSWTEILSGHVARSDRKRLNSVPSHGPQSCWSTHQNRTYRRCTPLNATSTGRHLRQIVRLDVQSKSQGGHRRFVNKSPYRLRPYRKQRIRFPHYGNSFTRMFFQTTCPALPLWICNPKKPCGYSPLSTQWATGTPLIQVFTTLPWAEIVNRFHPFRSKAALAAVCSSSQTG